MEEHQWLIDGLNQQGVIIFKHLGWWLVFAWLAFWWLMWIWGRKALQTLKGFYQQVSTIVKRSAFLQRHPHLTYQIRARFTLHHLTGLPLTLMGILFLTLLSMLAGLVEEVVSSETVVTIDHLVAQIMAQARSPEVVAFFSWMTRLGNTRFVLPFFILILLSLLWWGQRGLILPILVGLVGGVGTSSIGKWTFERPRPLEALLTEHSFSFPSSHATLAVAFYGILFYIGWRSRQTWHTQMAVLFIGCTLILLLGSSRLVLGVHFLSDVLAGYLLGALWLLIAISLLEWLQSTHHLNQDTPR